MIVEIDTINKTIVLKSSFLLDDLMALIQKYQIWDYKIQPEKEFIPTYQFPIPIGTPTYWYNTDILHNNSITTKEPDAFTFTNVNTTQESKK